MRREVQSDARITRNRCHGAGVMRWRPVGLQVESMSRPDALAKGGAELPGGGDATILLTSLVNPLKARPRWRPRTPIQASGGELIVSGPKKLQLASTTVI